MEVFPLITPGVTGVADETVTVKVCTPDEPHALFAFTEISPPVAPTVALMVVFVDVPVQPEGSIHVYDVAPRTGAML
jgi:hypothetical protein